MRTASSKPSFLCINSIHILPTSLPNKLLFPSFVCDLAEHRKQSYYQHTCRFFCRRSKPIDFNDARVLMWYRLFSTIFIRCFDPRRSCFTRILWTIDTKSEQHLPPRMVVCLEDDWGCDAVDWSCFGWRTLTTDTQTRHHRCYCDDGSWFQGNDAKCPKENVDRWLGEPCSVWCCMKVWSLVMEQS